MRTIHRVVLTLSAPLLFTACGDDAASGPDPTQDLCEVTAPVRLVAAPDGWQPDEYQSNFRSVVIDDRLLYSFQQRTPNGALGDVFLRDLCGGEPELVLSADSGLTFGPVLDFATAGEVLYGWRAAKMYVVDRLDEPGADVPKPVAGLTFENPDNLWLIEMWEHGPLFVGLNAAIKGAYNAAGIGGPSREVLTLGATPDAPATLLANNVVHNFPHAEQLAIHTDDGRVFLYDQLTGTRTPIVDSARWVSEVRLGERSHLLIQDMGDDVSEPVRLLDLETGESRQVTINDFVQSSFGRDPEHGSAGSWTGFSDDKSSFIALYGPDGTMLEGYDVATLEPVEIPDNLGRLHISGAPWMPLILPDPTDTVFAGWDPATGELREWYRGPEPEFDPNQMQWRDGKLEYTTEISDGVYRVSRLDPATGETTVVVPRRGSKWSDLEDGRIVTGFPTGERTYEVVLLDPAAATETTLVAETDRWEYDREHELILYTNFVDPEPGLWAAPIPPR